MTDLARLKDRIDVLDVLERVGARTEAWSASEEVKFFCPFCDDLSSSKPAGTANSLKGMWHCWSCGRGGDIFNAVMEHLTTERQDAVAFTDAIAWLLAEFPDEEVLLDPWEAAQ